MAEEEEVEKYKRLYEEQKAKVKELERQNSQLKVRGCVLRCVVLQPSTDLDCRSVERVVRQQRPHPELLGIFNPERQGNL